MNSSDWQELEALLADVRRLHQDLLEAEARQAAEIAAVRPRHRYSAANLVHYVELRRHDIRDMQARLARYGLTSLGRTESRVLASVESLLRTLIRLTGADGAEPPPARVPDGAELLAGNADALLGPKPEGRGTRIMVTFPSEAATDPQLVQDMLASGMDIARINCAHDGPEQWAAMIANIRPAEAALRTRCLVAMDLGGPKLRTGPVEPGPQVLKVRPVRTATGAVVEPALLWLGSRPVHAPGAADAPVLPLADPGWAGRRRAGETVRLVDARGSRRSLQVVQAGGGCLASSARTVYFVPGLELAAFPAGEAPEEERRNGEPDGDTVRVGPLPAARQALLVHRGDTVVLTRDLAPAVPSTGGIHRIGCTLPEVFTDVRPGERVLLDDGKIGGVVTAVSPDEVEVQVRTAAAGGTRLRAGKGINLPDTWLSVPALTEEDIRDLDFVKEHADIVSLSFVRSPADVQELISRLGDRQHLGIVLKIETVPAFEALPQILLEAMRWENIGVMIARGDLAVEAGFERLAEVQEEILWLCEAGHVPVIWATQVLDRLARTGVPSRAEVTDAAMAERAECVMLNKGPYIHEAITMLADILARMQDHMQKKRSLLRRLRSWDLGESAQEGPVSRR
ncbi:pyruvate kinase [Arthrobacter mobilis]|uniref:pyruvate kinase n=1 Tax=Arthrobacter mobilis TaxID=2724944 RepID=A0A7X6HH81_9MICC|nr:pyruvate kinase [Arthrobacter mobilis]NKX55607.1 pyruvate kinase [Arthrobacter mobilis]